MQLKIFILLIGYLLSTSTMPINTNTTVKPAKQIETKTDKELKFNELEVKGDNKPLDENLKLSQKDLIYKYREKAMNDPNYVENPKKELYGQDVKKPTKTKITNKKTSKNSK